MTLSLGAACSLQGVGNCCKSAQASSTCAGVQLPLPGGIGQQQGMVADLVDQPRHAVGGLVDALAGFVGQDLRALSAGGRNLRIDVILRLAAVEGFEVAAGDHPLVERFELRTGKMLLQHPAAGHAPAAPAVGPPGPGWSGREPRPTGGAAGRGPRRPAARSPWGHLSPRVRCSASASRNSPSSMPR